MPGMSGTRPVALASATISTIVFEPSTNSTSMGGFMFLRAASSTYAAGGERVNGAGSAGARGQVGTNGDVRLDVHHDHGLARADRGEGALRADVRVASRVDDDVHALGGADVAVGARDGERAARDKAG